jgi:hypothetical protein
MYVQVNVMRDWFQKFINSIIIGFTIGTDNQLVLVLWEVEAEIIQLPNPSRFRLFPCRKTCCFELDLESRLKILGR